MTPPPDTQHPLQIGYHASSAGGTDDATFPRHAHRYWPIRLVATSTATAPTTHWGEGGDAADATERLSCVSSGASAAYCCVGCGWRSLGPVHSTAAIT